jgi:type VI secretion system protein ImpI
MTPLFVVVEDIETHAATRHAFIKSPVRIGRSELNDLPLPLPFVSSWHAVVQFDERDVHYVDLGSTNGSSLDGVRLERNIPVAVGPETEIRIGTLRLKLGRSGVVPTSHRPVSQFALHVSALHLPAAGAPAQNEAGPVLPAQALDLVERALDNAAMDLDLLYASYRGAWEHFRAMIEQTLLGISGPARAAALARLAEKYGALVQEPQFRALSGVAEAPVPVPGRRGPTTDLVAAFGRAYLPAPLEPTTPEGAQELLARTADLLETFGKAYLELRKGYEEFGKEMGVSPVRSDSPVSRARDARELLAWLLDLHAEGRTAELERAFADLMVHQVALLNGVVEGARGILTRLSPEVVVAESPHVVFHTKAATHWKTYEERWHAIADEEDGISAALFGAEFARAYAAVIGRQIEDSRKPADSSRRHGG